MNEKNRVAESPSASGRCGRGESETLKQDNEQETGTGLTGLTGLCSYLAQAQTESDCLYLFHVITFTTSSSVTNQ